MERAESYITSTIRVGGLRSRHQRAQSAQSIFGKAESDGILEYIQFCIERVHIFDNHLHVSILTH